MGRHDKEKIQQLRTLVKTNQWPAKKKEAYEGYLEYLNANDKAMRTQTLYALHIHRLGDFRPQKNFKDYTEKDMVEYKTWLKEQDYAPYNIHNMLLTAKPS
ncbi:MAG: phage integrase N-terminal SAM-like domain-containing protein [Candidatus Diapherotrites archaeon]|uniref:Phage integrase N-terminal SAM-like domain-containing protein n=1 Tax=Candidatus Iainarchaeum sp. TaxID=3101447 RepID=A0A8T3YJX3_9ARCH|nr:phage integrase N-terminal SAM-like domain-containing protein [Candidatus Diapherotrites archaeon]